MEKRIKARWLRALRSGKYKQVKKRLRGDKTHYCCLGVLCMLLEPDQWEHSEDYGWDHRGEGEFPSQPVRVMAGLSEEMARQLAEMNDAGKRFATIANFIEKNA
jgi:hypothetical protein